MNDTERAVMAVGLSTLLEENRISWKANILSAIVCGVVTALTILLYNN